MKTSVALTRLIETASSNQATPKELANVALQVVEKVLGNNRNGPEALALIRNKFLRQGLDALDIPQTSRRSVSAATAKRATTIRSMPESAKSKISEAMTAYWRKRRAAEGKSKNTSKPSKKSVAAKKAKAAVNGIGHSESATTA